MGKYVPGLAAADMASLELMNKLMAGANKLIALGKRVEAEISKSNYSFPYAGRGDYGVEFSPSWDEYNTDRADDPCPDGYEYGVFLKNKGNETVDNITTWMAGFNVVDYIEDYLFELYPDADGYSDVWYAYENIAGSVYSLAEALDDWKKNCEEAEYEGKEGGWFIYPHKFIKEISIEDVASELIPSIERAISFLQDRIAEQQALEKWQEEGGKSIKTGRIKAEEFIQGLIEANSEAINYLYAVADNLMVIENAVNNVLSRSDIDDLAQYSLLSFGFPKEAINRENRISFLEEWVSGYLYKSLHEIYAKYGLFDMFFSPRNNRYPIFDEMLKQVKKVISEIDSDLGQWMRCRQKQVPYPFQEFFSDESSISTAIQLIESVIATLKKMSAEQKRGITRRANRDEKNRVFEQEKLDWETTLGGWEDEGGKSMSRKNDQVVSDPVTVCNDIADVAIEGVALLDQATGSKAPELIRSIANVLKTAKIKLESTEGVLAEDVSAIEGQIENLNDIASRNHHSDIRSWDARFVQREDARLALGQISQYWKNVMKAYLSDQYNRRKSAASKAEELAGVPNYRFKVGQMVKVGNRYGKVIGASKEGGTGKQVYDVRLNGSDKIRKCSTNEMKAMSDSKKSNLGFE